MSILLLIPVLAVAGWMISRYVKGEIAGEGGACRGCAKQSVCQKRACEEAFTSLK